MSGAAQRALLINSHGSYSADYQSLTGPVDSVAKFGQLLDWYIGKMGGLNPLGGPGQVWIIGSAACELLGWWRDELNAENARLSAAELQDFLAGVFQSLEGTGWELLGEPDKLSPQMLLVKRVTMYQRNPSDGTIKKDARGNDVTRTERRMVQLILEPFAEEITGRSEIGLLENLPEDDETATREVGRRVQWLTEQLGVLPTVSAATTGQRIQDEIYKARKKKGADKGGAVVDKPGVIKGVTIEGVEIGAGDEGAGVISVGELEPAAHWGRPYIAASEIPDECELLLLDQTAAYLATAGSIELGFGDIHHLQGDQDITRMFAAATAKSTSRKDPTAKWPFGIFLAVLPAGSSDRCNHLPKNMPLPHPLMEKDRDVDVWITTESVRGLCAPVEEGGGGFRLEDLAIDEAYIWDDTRRFLEDWAAKLRAVRLAAIRADDKDVARYIGAIYKHYVGRMGTDKWPEAKMYHWQPIWRAAIIAHCRWRARRQAMVISAQAQTKAKALANPSPWDQYIAAHGLWPIYTYTDSWRFLVPAGMQLAPTPEEVLALIEEGQAPALGRLIEEHREPLNAEQRALLLASTTGEEVSAVVYGRSGIPTMPLQDHTPTPPAIIDVTDYTVTDEKATSEDTDKDKTAAQGNGHGTGDAEPHKRRGKGQRNRKYIGNRAAELAADVSPAAVSDLKHLVATKQFSYLPDGEHHVSRTHERPAPVPEPVQPPPVPVPEPGQLVPLWWQRPAVIYTAVALVLILTILVIVLAVI
ncbi:Uncharacterised protein [Mycobacteroides abscessus subsp. bolletii]|uniref:hypothetical protein n=1 Tax=Mycobacteroides abscessus TaxID=36809 RepID=UPI0009A61F4B|nr:hypothetical protein [Mycobacteroides abscessus]SKZ04368.1 Uncharacterised protein [Mycobacteroides abscessus subsp. bolletii]